MGQKESNCKSHHHKAAERVVRAESVWDRFAGFSSTDLLMDECVRVCGHQQALEPPGDWSFLDSNPEAVRQWLASHAKNLLDQKWRMSSSPPPTNDRPPPRPTSGSLPTSSLLSDKELFTLSLISADLAEAVASGDGCGEHTHELLFSLTRTQGAGSFAKFTQCAEHYPGPMLLLVRPRVNGPVTAGSAEEGSHGLPFGHRLLRERCPRAVLGAFLPAGGLEESGSKYFGTSDTQILGFYPGREMQNLVVRKRATSGGSEFMILNRSSKYCATGVGFGGSNDKGYRLFLASHFDKVSIALSDSTYESGSLLGAEDDSFETVFAVEDVELWGFGGLSAKEQQNYKLNLHEDIKAERRKVDMGKMMNDDFTKTFLKKEAGGERAGEVEQIISEHKKGNGEED